MTAAESAAASRAGVLKSTASPRYLMPAEWEPHDATWIAWPHHEPDWPGKLGAIPWVYAEIVRVLHPHERVEILCHDETVRASASATLIAHGVARDGYHLHVVPNDRVWLRDSAPTFVWNNEGAVEMVSWRFNAWAKYENYQFDGKVGEAIEKITGIPRVPAVRPDSGEPLVLEGGGIEVDGGGRVMVTEEWLLSDIQVRNPQLTRESYESIFSTYLGATETIWLGKGCVGDDTHGHIDDIARFASPDVVLLAFEEDARDGNHAQSLDAFERLELAARFRPLRIVKLPYPRAVTMDGQRLPASYANFYIANGLVVVPTFNDPMDRVALNTIAAEFPGREIVGIHSVDLVWGLGTIHCLTQQQPRPRAPVLQTAG